MKNKTLLISLILLSFFFTACDSDDDIITEPTVNANSVDHSGFISEDETWSSDKFHILKDRVVIKSGVTLTIEPGTIVKGEAGTGANASSLVIARGAKINAAGTAEKPIIFTSIADEIALGEKFGINLDLATATGFWGGLIVLGNAPTSPKTGSTEQIEGIPADVYTESFHSLNFKSSYSLEKGKRSQVSFAVTNILNDIPVQVYRGFNAEDQIFSQRQLQRTFKVGYSLKIK